MPLDSVLRGEKGSRDLLGREPLEKAMDLATARGVPVEELAYALLARAGAQAPEKIPVLFVECNGLELEQYKAELEEQLPATVETVLVDELENRLKECASDTEPPWRLKVTIFYHVHEVWKLMEPRGIETFALLTETTLDALKRLAELSDETSVGVMGNSRTCTENLLRSLEGAGLDHLDFFQTREDDEESRARIGEAEAVMCGCISAQRLPKLDLPEGVEVIVQDRTLSMGGVKMLGRMLRRSPQTTE